jgi:hypothetical protein
MALAFYLACYTLFLSNLSAIKPQTKGRQRNQSPRNTKIIQRNGSKVPSKQNILNYHNETGAKSQALINLVRFKKYYKVHDSDMPMFRVPFHNS